MKNLKRTIKNFNKDGTGYVKHLNLKMLSYIEVMTPEIIEEERKFNENWIKRLRSAPLQV